MNNLTKIWILVSILLVITPIVNAGEETVKIYLDSMTAYEEYETENECNENSYEEVERDDDHSDEDIRAIFALGFPSNYNTKIPPGVTITSAVFNVWFDEEYDDGNVRTYASYTKRDSDCELCMDWGDAFDDCEIDEDTSFLGSEETTDNTWKNFDVTSEVKSGYENNKFVAFWMKGSADSDDEIRQDFGGNDGRSTRAPYLTITYKTQDCTPGSICCDSTGNFKPTTDICQTGLNPQYSCHWGTNPGDNVGVRYQVKYCSGMNSGGCNGRLEYGGWSVKDECTSNELCIEGNTQCNTACESHSRYSCFNNDIYWYDSCNNQEELKEDCSDTCSGNTCVELSSTNPTISIGNEEIWSHSGAFSSKKATVSNFEDTLNSYLETCEADSEGYCEVPVKIDLDSEGSLSLSNLRISYDVISQECVPVSNCEPWSSTGYDGKACGVRSCSDGCNPDWEEELTCNECNTEDCNEEQVLEEVKEIVEKIQDNTNIPEMKIEVGGTENLNQNFEGEQKIEFKEAETTIVEFDIDFSTETLEVENINIQKQEATATKGSLIISGITLPENKRKTVYIDRLDQESTGVCILDAEVLSITEMSDDCTGENEIFLSCNGVETEGYSCETTGDKYKITGLKHSAILETDICVPNEICDWSSTGYNGESCGDYICNDGCDVVNEVKETKTCSACTPNEVCSWSSTGYDGESCGNYICNDGCDVVNEVKDTKTCSQCSPSTSCESWPSTGYDGKACGVRECNDSCGKTWDNEKICSECVPNEKCSWSSTGYNGESCGDYICNDGCSVVDEVRETKKCSINTDKDKDGIRNKNDLCKNTPKDTPVDGNGCSCKEKTCDDNDILTKNSCETSTAECVYTFYGDLDGNGCVDYDDFFIFTDAFGTNDKEADFDNSGRVDHDDFFIFTDNFGKCNK